jgi:hypothetical protein
MGGRRKMQEDAEQYIWGRVEWVAWVECRPSWISGTRELWWLSCRTRHLAGGGTLRVRPPQAATVLPYSKLTVQSNAIIA